MGVDFAATARLMEWVMAGWGRVRILQQVPVRHHRPARPARLPSRRIACAAHVLVRADVPPRGVEAHVRGGVALQRCG